MDVQKEFRRNQVLLSVFPKMSYNRSIYGLMHGLQKKKSCKVCYVSLNKPAAQLMKSFSKHRIKTNKIFFIDAVSRGIQAEADKENVLYLSSPAALTELSIAISEAMKSKVFDVMIFDSLSTLNMYRLGGAAEEFTSSLINKVKKDNHKGVFTCLQDDVESRLVQNSCLYVDKVVYNKVKHTPASKVVAFMAAMVGGGGALLLNGQQGITGAAVIQQAGTGVVRMPLLIMSLLAVVAGLTYIYNTQAVRPVSKAKLLAMKPSKRNPDAIRKSFKAKIKQWAKVVRLF
jgi:hypothetical protein